MILGELNFVDNFVSGFDCIFYYDNFILFILFVMIMFIFFMNLLVCFDCCWIEIEDMCIYLLYFVFLWIKLYCL